MAPVESVTVIVVVSIGNATNPFLTPSARALARSAAVGLETLLNSSPASTSMEPLLRGINDQIKNKLKTAQVIQSNKQKSNQPE